MSQNDLTIANQGFASFRSDLNSALQALGSTNSGTSAPSTTFANQLFYDTTNNILKIRNEDNDAFISLFTLDQTNDNIESLTIDGTLNLNGSLDMGDNNKILLGAGDDLEIYHDGSNSYIDETGTGDLYIRANPSVYIQKYTGENMIVCSVDGSVNIYHNNVERFQTSANGIEVLNTTAGEEALVRIKASTSGNSAIAFGDTGNTTVGKIDYNHADNSFAFDTNSGERFRITSGGNVGIGQSSPTVALHVAGNSRFGNANGITANGNADSVVIENSGSAGISILSGSSSTGNIFFGDSGDNNVGEIQYNHSNNLLGINTGGTARMSIGSNILIGTTDNSPAESSTATGTRLGTNGGTQISTSGIEILRLNRNSDDGVLVTLCQGGDVEGQITVSGSTVTYGGGHLGRWSRLLDNNKDTSIVKGTVMTNLDEMVEWKHEKELWTKDDELPNGVSVGDVKKDAHTENNEQLNKMAISSVEGDANVSGVFVSWDNEDDYNDMIIAMTGDMVIRIAKDTTVSRGDLLMSAGDGTAKPQGDDIVRSKTIAKVTSTNKSHTYDDGTYLVPCVLMAC